MTRLGRRVKYVQRPVYRPTPARGRASKGSQRGRGRRLLALTLLLVGLVLLVNWFKISQISVAGTRALSPTDIKNQTQDQLNHHPLWRNLLSINGSKLGSELVAGNVRLKSVSVKARWPHGLVVTVVERQPALVWRTGETNYLVDSEGSVIGPADVAAAGLPTVVDSTNLPAAAGRVVVSPRFVSFTTAIVGGLPAQTALKVAELRVPDTTTELYAKVDKGYTIKFDTTKDPADQLNKLKTVLAELKRLSKTPAEYIDLRVEAKAYYK